ncbi:MAG: FAD:protein transferase, partial [Blastocatellia bacterium]
VLFPIRLKPMNDPAMVTLSTHTMATRFELLLYGADEVRLRAAGEEALAEIERLEAQLSFYRADSEINWINNRAAKEAVRVEPRLFHLLKHCAAFTRATDGAFDITIGPLMRAWRFISDSGAIPALDELEAARQLTGMQNVELDEDAFTIRFKQPGVQLDLGAYGKGYAIERAIDSLKENGVRNALLHGGTSSAAVIGKPPGQPCWRIQLSEPFKTDDRFITLDLADEALSVSAIHGKAFTTDGRTYGHIIDPRAGVPVNRAVAAAVAGQSASTCEVLSTALLVLGPAWLGEMSERFVGYRGAVAYHESDAAIAIARHAC